MGRDVHRCNIRTNGALLLHIVGDKIIPFSHRLTRRTLVVHGSILLLSDKVLDAGFVFIYGLVELVCFLLGLDLSSFTRLAT